jgi:hypothetical protein
VARQPSRASSLSPTSSLAGARHADVAHGAGNRTGTERCAAPLLALQVENTLEPIVHEMWHRSPTFRRQVMRLAREPALVVTIAICRFGCSSRCSGDDSVVAGPWASAAGAGAGQTGQRRDPRRAHRARAGARARAGRRAEHSARCEAPLLRWQGCASEGDGRSTGPRTRTIRRTEPCPRSERCPSVTPAPSMARTRARKSTMSVEIAGSHPRGETHASVQA